MFVVDSGANYTVLPKAGERSFSNFPFKKSFFFFDSHKTKLLEGKRVYVVRHEANDEYLLVSNSVVEAINAALEAAPSDEPLPEFLKEPKKPKEEWDEGDLEDLDELWDSGCRISLRICNATHFVF
jgi:hypothetical protein